MKARRGILLLWLLAAPLLAAAQAAEKVDTTLSPYFLVKSEDASVDCLPMKSTSAEVSIAGVIADVAVTQVYENHGAVPLEAVYVFPASTRAAVYGMKMWVGERVIEARIQEKKVARKIYEQAKREGKSASLLEQDRPNVFTMNVANILPGDVIKVELRYTELMIPVDKVYEFVYPTVVGPRYSNVKASEAPASENWISNPYLHEGEEPPYTFDIRVELSTGIPIQDLACATHKTHIDYRSPDRAAVSLESAESNGGDRDFILRYRLAGSRIQSGLLLYEGKEENFFLLMMQPPERFSASLIPSREYIFVVDVSGSMNGFPLNVSKALLKDLIGGLRSEDRFNVVLFAGGSRVLSPGESLPASRENIQGALDCIDRQRGGGGTELLPALRRAFELPLAEGVSRTMVIVTDGFVGVEEQSFRLIREKLGEANVFAFGIGTSVNRHLIEGMARAGGGEPLIVTRESEAEAKVARFRKLIESPLLTDIRVEYEGFKAFAVEPSGVPDVLADRPVLLFGKWECPAEGRIVIEGWTGEGPYHESFLVAEAESLQAHGSLRYLWARNLIAYLNFENSISPSEDRVRTITTLGLDYNLLTPYTSFIAVDITPRRVDPNLETVKQALPLPNGVTDLAVGSGTMPTTPEPETWILIICALAALIVAIGMKVFG